MKTHLGPIAEMYGEMHRPITYDLHYLSFTLQFLLCCLYFAGCFSCHGPLLRIFILLKKFSSSNFLTLHVHFKTFLLNCVKGCIIGAILSCFMEVSNRRSDNSTILEKTLITLQLYLFSRGK